MLVPEVNEKKMPPLQDRKETAYFLRVNDPLALCSKVPLQTYQHDRDAFTLATLEISDNVMSPLATQIF